MLKVLICIEIYLFTIYNKNVGFILGKGKKL